MSAFDDIKEVAAFGGGFGGVLVFGRWLIKWITDRFDKRQEQLNSEHAALDMSWKDYRLLLERERAEQNKRISTIEAQNRALRLAFEHVAGALIRIDPQNPALSIAERWMASAFPADMTIATARAEDALSTTGAVS